MLTGDEMSDAPELTRSGRRAADRARLAPKRTPQASRKPARRAGNGPARVFATVLVVPALVGTVALPAYALMPGGEPFGASGAFSLSVADAQDVEVSTLASGAPLSADGYAVTTKASIDRARLDQEAKDNAASAANLASRGSGSGSGSGSYAVYTVKVEGDDYPWWDQLPDDYGGGLSPLRYYFRECVDFAAWRLNRDAGVTSGPWKWDWASLGAGNASSWADAWARHGWPTSSEPVVGAIAWFPYNHVAYVQSINGDGTVNIEEYNQNSDHSYHRRTIPTSSALYLYPPG